MCFYRIAFIVLHLYGKREGNRVSWACFQTPKSFEHIANVVQCEINSLRHVLVQRNVEFWDAGVSYLKE